MNPDMITIPSHGFLKFYREGRITAHCTVHSDHNKDCRRSRTIRESAMDGRDGQGRPIGLLVAWLKDPNCHGKVARTHVHSLKDRLEARSFFNSLPGSSEFSQHERERGRWESEEPFTLP